MDVSSQTARWAGLDAFRGLTIAAMLLVNNPGSWSPAAIYPQLQHAAWNGWTITDLVFPFFLFAVGVSMVFSHRRRLGQGADARSLRSHAAARGVALVLLGLAQARFPLLQRHPRGLTAALGAVGFGGCLLRGALLACVVALVGGLIAGRARRRWAVVFALGLGMALVGALTTSRQDLHWMGSHLGGARVPGVLQRIGVCVLATGAVGAVRWSRRRLLMWTAGLLVISAVWSLYAPIPGFGRPDLSLEPLRAGDPAHPQFSNWGSWVDARVFGFRSYQVVRDPATGAMVWGFDPEGAASTPGAVASVLLGIAVGQWLAPLRAPSRRVVGQLLVCGAAGLAAGAALDRWIPINKQLWTSSYAVFTAAMACVVLAACVEVLQSQAGRRFVAPFVWYGRNALLLFLGSSLAATLAVHMRVPDGATADGSARLVPLKAWVFARLSQHLAVRQASLLHAVGVVVVWALVAGLLARRRVFVKL